jgi:hypothetical protein
LFCFVLFFKTGSRHVAQAALKLMTSVSVSLVLGLVWLESICIISAVAWVCCGNGECAYRIVCVCVCILSLTDQPVLCPHSKNVTSYVILEQALSSFSLLTCPVAIMIATRENGCKEKFHKPLI